ncbi:unnamed protein product [Nyctereutes procyonoides]|uniref:(raccoon dog) hypothetical protein n=1 Tax=Nyctereutes procyonoides TaxID=34880 RepID=A0A811Y4U1_NYCPR|nr:unnamed protein product [Nyctereutes procyonoides]
MCRCAKRGKKLLFSPRLQPTGSPPRGTTIKITEPSDVSSAGPVAGRQDPGSRRGPAEQTSCGAEDGPRGALLPPPPPQELPSLGLPTPITPSQEEKQTPC